MKTRTKALAAASALCLAALVAFGADIVRSFPVPASWLAATGDYFGLNSSAVPTVRIGTNTFTGISTNVYMTNTYVIQIRNGVVVGINP